MTYKGLFLGAIGVLTETSDLQRRAFNTAFEINEIDWHWDADTYRDLLTVPGGRARLRHYRDLMDAEVDIDAIYKAKVTAFEQATRQGLALRDGIGELMMTAKDAGMKLGFVTGTHPRQVGMILGGLNGQVPPSTFDYVGDSHKVDRAKPAPDIYLDALKTLKLNASDVLAIEDTPESAAAAVAAGIETLGYPGAMAQGRSFGPRVTVVDQLDVAMLGAAQAA